jgi:L,D-peptidoglycan transpeptidase YkuD (ErfK/YbiS/YcfS/YnhG family)
MRKKAQRPASAGRVVALRARSLASTRGAVSVAGRRFLCALGRSGLSSRKREGDGATPSGFFAFRQILYRADRIRRPASRCPVRALRESDAWCDTPGDRNYNRLVAHPYPVSAERLWRADALYDVIAVLGYNDRPRIQGRGSAIFVHVARPGFTPTEGCIALGRRDLEMLLAAVGPRSVINIGSWQKRARSRSFGPRWASTEDTRSLGKGPARGQPRRSLTARPRRAASGRGPRVRSPR